MWYNVCKIRIHCVRNILLQLNFFQIASSHDYKFISSLPQIYIHIGGMETFAYYWPDNRNLSVTHGIPLQRALGLFVVSQNKPWQTMRHSKLFNDYFNTFAIDQMAIAISSFRKIINTPCVESLYRNNKIFEVSKALVNTSHLLDKNFGNIFGLGQQCS